VLVALNITDEYFRQRDQQSVTHDDLHDRALRLERIVDEALAQVATKRAV
jgi:hypothetical protein